MRKEQNSYGRADLYNREWELSYPRDQVFIQNLSNSSFTVMQFNMLAEGLSSCPNNRPFRDTHALDQRDPAGYGGFSSLRHPAVTLDFERRKWRLVEVLFGETLDTPYDIFGLQEVDRYHGFFGPLLEKFGYDSIFVPKKNSPGVRMGWYSDGCVLAWKSCTFTLIHKRCGDYTVGNQIYIVATLQHQLTKKFIVVAVTHLKAQQNEVNEVIRSRRAISCY